MPSGESTMTLPEARSLRLQLRPVATPMFRVLGPRLVIAFWMLAVTNRERLPSHPIVPTRREQGWRSRQSLGRAS